MNVRDAIGRDRFGKILVGQERCGKSFLAKHLSNLYINKYGGNIVYNYGQDDDYPLGEYLEFEPLSPKEYSMLAFDKRSERTDYLFTPKIEAFRDLSNGKIYSFKDFNKIYWFKKVRFKKIHNRRMERYMFTAIEKYVSNFLLTLDDSRAIFQYGMKPEHTGLISRKNHSGSDSSISKKIPSGIDILTMYHDMDDISNELIRYSDSIIIFESISKPILSKFNDKKIKEIISHHWESLSKMKKYSSIELFLKGEKKYKSFNSTLKI